MFFVSSLQQIIDLDEKNQILTSNVWLDLTWKDAYMMWNISDYNNITVITIIIAIIIFIFISKLGH